MVKDSSTQVPWPQLRSILFLGIPEKNEQHDTCMVYKAFIFHFVDIVPKST